MRTLIFVLSVALACGKQRATDGAPTAPDVTTPTVPTQAPPTQEPPTDPPYPTPTPSDAWDIEDVVGATETCSSNFGCPIPRLAVDRTGAPIYGVHRLNLGPCLLCSADRIVRRWNGAGWDTLISARGWPGTCSDVSLAGDPASRATLFADPDLSDPYHPPIRLHVWDLGEDGATEVLPALGDQGIAADPVLAVDDTGTVTVTWLEVDDSSNTPVVRSARSVGATWDLLPELPVPATGFGADGAWVALDATDAPVVAACGPSAIHVARWDAATRAWQVLPPPPSSSAGCSVRALRDGGGLLLASGTSSVSVDRWDGTSWTPVGRGLGHCLFDLARSPRGTPLMITCLGILELTDAWHVIAGPDVALPNDFVPVAMASGKHELWTWWVREANYAHPSGAQLRRMTLRDH
jgi:hypothetical protein